MFRRKKLKLPFNPKEKPCVIWSDDSSRVIRTLNDQFIIEEKFYSVYYNEDYWLTIPNEKIRIKILEKALNGLLTNLSNI